MTDRFRLTIAQLNPTLGDLEATAAKARAAWDQARQGGAQMLALPELFLTGHPLQDLARKPAFLRDALAAVERLAADCADGPAIGIGCPLAEGGQVRNAYLILQGGRVAARISQHELLEREQSDARRLFDPAPISGPFCVADVRIGVALGADARAQAVTETQAETGAEILLVPDASPYHRGAADERTAHMVARVVESGLPLVWLNMTGGQDNLVHDGASFVLNRGGHKVVQLAPFEEAVEHIDFIRTAEGWQAEPGTRVPQPDEWEQDYRAMVQGLGDYMRKSGFGKALLGLSGGVDSALVATIAADALGPENVRGVRLPSVYSSGHSLDDADELARRLGIRMDTVPIEGPRQAVTDALAGVMAGTAPDVTEENIQARLRGLLLMAISNKFGEMLLTTGNKSEAAVGYATIYGDMAGSFNPILDLYKTRVFGICRWRNDHHLDWMAGPAGEVIPVQIIAKPPSAELRPGQTDQDSLPPYDVLDRVLEGLVEGDLAVADLVAQGFEQATVKRVEALLYGSEWKRWQAAPGLRLTRGALGLDRRYPMVNKWRDRG
ncbi:MAG TPA: NAD+ synthase [Paracoccus sp. (in: a-proteobacteria)]|nr:NAD+ synthase [Paracoccus sp. (in: a-proteobacteria)]